MLNRRFFLLGATALPAAMQLEGCAARANGIVQPPPTVGGNTPSNGPLATAKPGPSWTGDPLSGYSGGVAPVTPTTMVGATSNRPMPTAHWFTVPLQSFCDDFTVHVFAGAPNGIASVEFFHENPSTTTVSAPQHNAVVNGTLPLAMRYNTFAITLPAADWCNDAAKGGGTKQGATLYAKITANPVAGVTIFPRIIGPLRICPRFPINGLPNDKVVLITPDGKDDNGNPVVAPSNGTVVNSIAQAELLIGNGGAYASSFNPLVKFMKSGTYTISNQRGWGSLAHVPTSFWTLTHAVGVAVTISAPKPSYNAGPHGPTDLIHWYWIMMRGLPEFRGAGLTFDHKNFAGFMTDTGPSWVGPGGVGYWDNQCKHTLLGVPAVTDPTSGLSSPLYNTYWNGGPHPGFGLAPNNSDQSYGVVGTGATYEYVCAHAGGGNTSNLNLECKFRETRSGLGANQQVLVGTYSKGQVTSFFDPGVADLFTIKGPAGSTVAYSGGPETNVTLTLHDGAGTQNIVIGFGPGDGNYTAAELAITVNSRSGWTLTPGAAAALGWSAKWFMTNGGEAAFSGLSVSSATSFRALQPIHTEWHHLIGYYTVSGAPRVDNLLWMNNVQRKNARWGSATVQAEGTGTASINRPDNSYIVNNIFESTTYDGDMSAMTGGSFNTVANNYHDIQEIWDANLNGTDATRWGLNISTHLVGTPTLNGTQVDHNMTPSGASTHAIHSTNTDLSALDIARLFVSAADGDYRPGSLSVLAAHPAVSPEPYDLFGNLRDPAGDYAGPVSKNQGSAPTWPF